MVILKFDWYFHFSNGFVFLHHYLHFDILEKQWIITEEQWSLRSPKESNDAHEERETELTVTRRAELVLPHFTRQSLL